MVKVAAYCRVSTDKDDQANSFESQCRYFREYIDRQPDWELYEVYADEGITGTSTKKRNAFNRMILDAQLGRFSLILTKEVSRFSRNILDTISYTRELKAMGVGVLFMNDGISTLEPDAELRLSIMGSIAQEESRKTSVRVKWGQTRQMERGVVFGRSMLGYDVKDGRMTVNPTGAEIVRLIFHKYVHERKGTTVIARELREAGYRTLRGSIEWRNTVILKILKNEKYCGDLKQKKTITPDYLTHQKKYNHGEEEFVFLRNHHEPIVDRELWTAAQQEIARRDIDGKYGTGHGNRYPLSGKLKCGICGSTFVSRQRKRQNGEIYKSWRCGRATEFGRLHMDNAGNLVGCDMGKQMRNDTAMELLRKSVSVLQAEGLQYSSETSAIVRRYIASLETGEQISEEEVERQIYEIDEQKKNVLNAFFSHSITKEDMKLMNEQYDRQLAGLNDCRAAIRRKQELSLSVETLRMDLQREFHKMQMGSRQDDLFLGGLLHHMTVYPDGRAEIFLNLLPPKWFAFAESLLELQERTQSAENPAAMRLCGALSHYDPDIWGIGAKNEGPQTQCSCGFEALSHCDCSVPISVRIALNSG